MNRQSGKRAEWEIILHGNNALTTTFQDYTWADEVLHVPIGRRWLVPQVGDRERVAECVEGAAAMERAADTTDPPLAEAHARDRWPAFHLLAQQAAVRHDVD